jgi:hypothetical protein
MSWEKRGLDKGVGVFNGVLASQSEFFYFFELLLLVSGFIRVQVKGDCRVDCVLIVGRKG